MSPLPDRLRPANLDEFVGQPQLLRAGSLLRTMVERKELSSMIFHGPPGTGKTTLARILAKLSNADVVELSAVNSGVADVRKVVERAQQNQRLALKTVLFIDELHRFNKAQQDAFLPHVENGIITFIGATTEHPSFEVIAPLLSRCQVLTFEQLTMEDLNALIDRALTDEQRGLGLMKLTMESKERTSLIHGSGGDARVLLNALELASTMATHQQQTTITENHIREALQQRTVLYDTHGEEHYNTISAFIKSMRGSDPNAALYYLARMIEAREDALFIARRMVIFASEDIGLANASALLMANACYDACHRIGWPEAQLTLAHCATYLAKSAKSRAITNALASAQEAVKRTRDVAIPLHLRNAATKLMKEQEYAKGYTWKNGTPHIEDESKTFLPDELKGVDFFE